MLSDSLGRTVEYLRLSLTAACPLRCVYCRPSQQPPILSDDALTVKEIGELVTHLVARHALQKVRLTGGDPTSRPDLVEIIRTIAGCGVQDLAVTTHGLSLRARADEYAAAGLRRVNVSLDTLDRDQFREIAGLDGLDRVLQGIDAAIAAGLHPVRLNTVVLRGQNEGQLPALLRFAAAKRLEIRFIELMPMGPLAGIWADRFIPVHRMRELLSPEVACWHTLARAADSAERFEVELTGGGRARVGFISAMSCPFCAACNRIRIAADGTLFPCLMDRPAGNIMSALRPGFDPDRLDELLRYGLARKSAEHPATGATIMTHIGG